MVVADFGLATRAVSEKGSNPRDPADNPHAGVQTAHSHSQHTQNVGTELYRAPEQSGNHYDEKVDVFALGIMLVELLYPMVTKMERVQVLTDARQAHLPRELEADVTLAALRDLLAADPRLRPDAKQLLYLETLLARYRLVASPKFGSIVPFVRLLIFVSLVKILMLSKTLFKSKFYIR